jgi:hypothetical protein
MMTFAVFVLFFVLKLFAVTLAAPLDEVASPQGPCKNLLERKEWYALLSSVVDLIDARFLGER